MRSGLFLIFGILCSVGSAGAGIRVVSDIDDTAKVTNVGSTWPAIWNGLFTTRSFTGMAELYQSLARERGYEFEYLTGSPAAIGPRVRRFLRLNRYPEGGLTLKPTFGSESTHDYKVRSLREMLVRFPDDQFILIGDDTQADVDAYDDLYRFAPDRILAIYIRKVENEKLPPSIYPFLTAFEIARTEYLMKRMTVEQASPVALAILSEPKESRIFPHFVYCPAQKDFSFLDDRMAEWNRQIEDRTQVICRKRHLLMEE